MKIVLSYKSNYTEFSLCRVARLLKAGKTQTLITYTSFQCLHFNGQCICLMQFATR